MVIDDNKKKIVIIGAGNVATHLSKALDVQNDVIAVFSRSLENAETLAKCLKCAKATKDLSSGLALSENSIRNASPEFTIIGALV